MEDKLWVPNLGNGRFKNPVLYADYSDPDVIRIDDTFYMTASSFQYTPGLPILKSKNLVDWELVQYALPKIPYDRYDLPQISCGVWAPAMRYHDGKVWIFFGMPDEGIFAIWAEHPEDKFSEMIPIKLGKGLIDPCPYWDEQGNGYIIHAYAKSRIGFKSVLGIFQFQAEGEYIDAEDELLFDGHPEHFTIEGPKVHKRNGYYYIFAPAGGVVTGWQTVLRSEHIKGPYTIKTVMMQGESPINGPHQGAWVDDLSGQDYFVHFQDKGAMGRIVHVQRMIWENDWPIIGKPIEGETYGEPELELAIPYTKENYPSGLSLQASDDFSMDSLGLQWQWFANPNEAFYTLDNGLNLFALGVDDDADYSLWNKSNILSQKLVTPNSKAEVTVDFASLKSSDRAGLVLVGGQYRTLAIRKTADQYKLELLEAQNMEEEQCLFQEDIQQTTVILGVEVSMVSDKLMGEFYYKHEEKGAEIKIGDAFELQKNTWTGAKLALYAIGKNDEKSFARFLNFKLSSLEQD